MRDEVDEVGVSSWYLDKRQINLSTDSSVDRTDGLSSPVTPVKIVSQFRVCLPLRVARQLG